MTTKISPLYRVLIIGGGFSGACAAVQLVKSSSMPLKVTVVDAREKAGPGMAFSSPDPDHRLNGPAWSHSIDPTDCRHFERWCQENDIFAQDPESVIADRAFVRRSVFGDYLADMLKVYGRQDSGSSIQVEQDYVTGLRLEGDLIIATTRQGREIPSDLTILATGNAEPRLQYPIRSELAAHPGVVENPLDVARLEAIDPDARVLLVGSGLTALDVLCTLRRRGLKKPITVISRKGLRPTSQEPFPAEDFKPPTGRDGLDRLDAPPAEFLAQAEPTARSWLRAVRRQVRERAAAGESWHRTLDAARDSLWQLWPTLPQTEQRRILRRLRTWYDVHRFRQPPQTEAIVRRALEEESVVHLAAKLLSLDADPSGSSLTASLGVPHEARPRLMQVDVVVNCTGLDAASRTANCPLLSGLVAQGWLTPDPVGLGYAVNHTCSAIDADGNSTPYLRVFGAPTLGTFGDPAGVPYISAHIHRAVPDILDYLRSRQPDMVTF